MVFEVVVALWELSFVEGWAAVVVACFSGCFGVAFWVVFGFVDDSATGFSVNALREVSAGCWEKRSYRYKPPIPIANTAQIISNKRRIRSAANESFFFLFLVVLPLFFAIRIISFIRSGKLTEKYRFEARAI